MKKQPVNLVLTGVDELDQIIRVLLSTSMFVAAVLGFALDNTIPGLGASKLITLTHFVSTGCTDALEHLRDQKLTTVTRIATI